MNATTQTHAETARRTQAFTILESIEELIWAATKRNETVPQTRLYYEKIVAGYDPDTPKPLYADAAWGDEVPPPREAGIDPRTRGEQHVRVKMEDDDGEERGGAAAAASYDAGSGSGAGGVRIKVEAAQEQDQGPGGSPGLRRREDAASGDKRKRGRKGGQSPRMPGL